jgi:uncharacterized protein (TIGR03437 family)
MTKMRDIQVCCMLLPLAFAFLGITFGQPVPRILTNGIVSAAGAPLTPAPVAPGGIISIYGSNFNSSFGIHAGGVSAASAPLPTIIGSTQVLINSVFAPLYYVDSSQVNAQVPWEVNGASYLTVQVIVNGLPSNLSTVGLAPNAPGILAVTHASDGSRVEPSAPAAPGEYLTIYAVGLGAVTNAPSTGAAPLATPLSYTILTPIVTIGGVAANVVFSGLTPGFSGLYQVNAQVASGIPNGDDVSVVLSVGGALSNTVTISVESGAPSGVRVSVSPVSVSLLTGATQQFTAAVSESSDSSLSWSVDGIPGGNSTVGTISSSGLYTAPASPPNGSVVFVAAMDANSTVAGTATVAVSAPAAPPSPLGRVRSNAPGLWSQFEQRGFPSQYWPGQAIQMFTQFDPVVGSTVSEELSLQLDKQKAMGLNAITYEFRSANDPTNSGGPFVPPVCPIGGVLGLNWPQPTTTELTNLRAFFDLVQSKGMRVRVHLANTYMDDRANSQIWLAAILGVIGNHPALDVVMFDGDKHIEDDGSCGTQAEPPLWMGPASVQGQYVQWAIQYAQSLGIPARRLSAEAIVGAYFVDSMPPNSFATDDHLWNPPITLKAIFDQIGIPDNQRTYALSYYEHTKCTAVTGIPCTDLAPHPWAEQTLQTIYGIIGTGNGSRVVATEMGYLPPVIPSWKTEWAVESLATLMEKYQIEGGSFWRWVSFMDSEDSDPTLANPVKIRGMNFVYNPVQKEILDWSGFHLSAIPNGSFEDDLDSNGVPTHWAVTGNGSAAAYYLPQETGQPRVPSRGSYCLRLTASDSTAPISATSDPIAVTPGTSYTTVANMRFAWSGDPSPSGNATTRPQVYVTIHYLNANGQPASVPSTIFQYFQENSTQGFQTFVFQYTTPNDARWVQIEVGAARHGLATPIVVDADNFR